MGRRPIDALWIHWLKLAACAALILAAGARLARYGDVITQHVGLGGGWIGVVLVGSVTSLPELVTGISSVTVADVPDIAVGNVLGACVLNMAMLVVLDALHRKGSTYSVAGQDHVLGAAFSVVMLGVIGFGVLSSPQLRWSVGHVGGPTVAMLVLYAAAIRTLHAQARAAGAAARRSGRTRRCARPAGVTPARRRSSSPRRWRCPSLPAISPRRWAGATASSARCWWRWRPRCPR